MAIIFAVASMSPSPIASLIGLLGAVLVTRLVEASDVHFGSTSERATRGRGRGNECI